MSRMLYALLLIVAILLPQAPALATVTVSSATPATFAPVGNEWYMARLGVPVAWHFGADGYNRTYHKRVHVLVIDTGLDQAVATQVLSGTTGLSWTFNPKLSAHQDAVGHGTFVSTEIGGHGNGYYGICPECLVSMARVFGAKDGADTRDITKAILWGIQQHVDVISMSLGGPDEDPNLAAALLKAQQAGILAFCAAGNSGNDTPNYPAADAGCYAVSATNYQDQVTSWSSYGSDVALASPGELIAGYLPFHANEIGGYGFVTISGTSMATPLVAGAAADLLSLGLSPTVAVAVLEAGARKVPGYTAYKYGAGVLDLTGALRQLGYKV